MSKLRPLYQRTRLRPNGNNQELLINVNGRVPNTTSNSSNSSSGSNSATPVQVSHSTGLTVTPTTSSTPITTAPAPSTSTPNVKAYDWANSPISPRAQPNDPKGGWKITGKRIQQFQVRQI